MDLLTNQGIEIPTYTPLWGDKEWSGIIFFVHLILGMYRNLCQCFSRVVNPIGQVGIFSHQHFLLNSFGFWRDMVLATNTLLLWENACLFECNIAVEGSHGSI